ncbi:MAG: type III secretion system gatekeeper subunit SctW [Candidatus Competibacteraceae bacterium]|jgi:type III secretion protein W|nr:type III secretion system gatekeeper subunit SctW [Candidatus Competibacteraceae bacterium]
MPDPIIQSGFQNVTNLANDVDTDTTAADIQGVYNNSETVQLKPKDASSLLADALEELTSELSEDKEKELAKRDVEEGKESDMLERLMKLNEIEEMVNSLHDLRKNDLERALKALLRMKDSNPRQLRERARQEFKEPAHQFAALSALVSTLRKQGAPKEQLENAEKALQQLLDEDGPAVRAGINVSSAAAKSAGDQLGDIQGLRDTYRDAVLDYQGIGEAFKSLSEKYGAAELPKAIDFMLNALGADMAADGASIEKSKLNAIRDDMYRLQTLAGMLESCNALVDKMRSQGAFSAP